MTESIPSQNLELENNISHEEWRENFLRNILIGAAIIGFLALIPAVASTNNRFIQGTYVGVFLVLVISILIPLPYRIKASLFVLLTFILGLSSLTETGIRGDGIFFLLSFVTFSALLLSPRAGIVAIIISELAIVILGFLVLGGQFTLTDPEALDKGNILDFLSAGVSMLLISWVVLAGLRMLTEGFEQARAKAASMVDTLRDYQINLEERVDERTEELARKTRQLNASASVARQTAVIQDLGNLLTSTTELISEQFGFYHVGLFLLNERGDNAVLQAASSVDGKSMLERGHRVRVGAGNPVGIVTSESKPHLIADYQDQVTFFQSTELQNTRSRLTLPLTVRDKVIGALDIQAAESHAFQQDEVEIYQTLADQIAVAIENVRLLDESQLVISQLQLLSGETTRQSWKTEMDEKRPGFHYTPTGIRPLSQDIELKGENTIKVPLILQGRNIGRITLRRKPDLAAWTAQEEQMASEVAAQAALALENVRLIESTRERATREQSIALVANQVRESLDLSTVLRTSARELQRAFNLQEAEVRLISSPNNNEQSTIDHSEKS